MQPLARNGYTASQIKAALHSANRCMSFRYELLDKDNSFKQTLNNVMFGRVECNPFADIKRTAEFTVLDGGEINYLRDRIKPWVRLKMPDGGWAEWPFGVFLLPTPTRKIDMTGVITRNIQAYDQLQILLGDIVENRYTVASGTNYITAVQTVLTGASITLQNLTPTAKTLPTARDWPPGTTKLTIVNDLLGAINYRSLYFDENGYAVAEPYQSPSVRASEYTYQDDDESVIFPEAEQTMDLFFIPNKWVLVCSEPDRIPIISTYTNTNENSPTSTINRGFTITDYREYEEAADQDSLDRKALRLAFNASQIYEIIEFKTALMPMHSDSDVYTLKYSKMGILDKYSETSWSTELRAGAEMSHRIRRVVNI